MRSLVFSGKCLVLLLSASFVSDVLRDPILQYFQSPPSDHEASLKVSDEACVLEIRFEGFDRPVLFITPAGEFAKNDTIGWEVYVPVEGGYRLLSSSPGFNPRMFKVDRATERHGGTLYKLDPIDRAYHNIYAIDLDTSYQWKYTLVRKIYLSNDEDVKYMQDFCANPEQYVRKIKGKEYLAGHHASAEQSKSEAPDGQRTAREVARKD